MLTRVSFQIVAIVLSIFIFGCSATTQNRASKESLNSSGVSTPMTLYKNPKKLNKSKRVDTLYQLYYGTNRKPIDMNDDTKGYGNQRGNRLYTGSCRVFIPASHKIGEVDGSLWEKIIHLDSSYGKIRVKDIKRYKNSDKLWSIIRDRLKDISRKEALIFIHGYNNSFNSSAIRAGQIGYDLGFKGVMAFYSWPSVGSPVGYSSDEATIQASEKYMKEFLIGFVKKSGVSKVNIIAHSMGNRGLIRVVNDIQKEYKDIRFGQIILAAPDVDADLFKNIAKAYTEISDKTTLYVSSKDKAVKLSKIEHNHPRAGLVEPVTIVEDIDTVNVNIDFTNLFSKFLNLNHTYFAKEQRILDDIKRVLKIKNSRTIKRRANKSKNSQEYWTLDIK